MRSRISLFILIGLFLYIIDYRFSYDEDLNQIIIPDDEILGLIDTWRDQVGRDPSDEEIVRIINNLVNEEILYREALKLELDKNDRIIKRRLAQKVEFLKQDDRQPSSLACRRGRPRWPRASTRASGGARSRCCARCSARARRRATSSRTPPRSRRARAAT